MMKPFNKHINEEGNRFFLFYLNHKDQVFSQVRPQLAKRQDAFDIALEVFVHLWSWKVYLSPLNNESIIATTCQQKVAKFYRKKKSSLSQQVVASDTQGRSSEATANIIHEQPRLPTHDQGLEFPPSTGHRTLFNMGKPIGIFPIKISEKIPLAITIIKYHIYQTLYFLKKYLNS